MYTCHLAAVQALAVLFLISGCIAQTSQITVTSPNGGSVGKGQTLDVRWVTSSNIPPDTLMSVDLLYSGDQYSDLGDSVNDGFKQVEIPFLTRERSGYRIRVEVKSEPSIYGLSTEFRVGEEDRATRWWIWLVIAGVATAVGVGIAMSMQRRRNAQRQMMEQQAAQGAVVMTAVPVQQPGYGASYPQAGYPPPGPQGPYDQQGGYDPNYPPQGGYPPQGPGGYPPPQQGGYPPQQGGYPPQQGGYPPQQGYPPQGYPPQQGQQY